MLPVTNEGKYLGLNIPQPILIIISHDYLVVQCHPGCQQIRMFC